MKTGILEAIGAADLNRPAQVQAALAANDRLKYYLSALQLAIAHAIIRNRAFSLSRLTAQTPNCVRIMC